jgi:hypothetical protein
VMLCAAVARIGPVPLAWWAVWDRGSRTLAESTVRGKGPVRFEAGRVRVDDGPARIDLAFSEQPGVETVSPHGGQYIWTRKQGGIAVRGEVTLAERRHEIDGRGIVDDSAGYHARHTAWLWSAGVGVAASGAEVAWNLVTGVHDAPRGGSERSVWVDGEAHEVGPVTFAPDLSSVAFAEGGELRFTAEATRARRERLVVFSSLYEQPFGTFTGTLPGAGPLRRGWGVMERHDVRW